MGRAPRTLSERPGTRRASHSGRAHPALALQLRSRRDWLEEAGMYGRGTSPAASCTRTRPHLARSPHPGHCAPVTPCSSAYAPARGVPASHVPSAPRWGRVDPTPLRFGESGHLPSRQVLILSHARMADGSVRAAWKFARLYAVGVDWGGCSHWVKDCVLRLLMLHGMLFGILPQQR